MSTPLLYAYFYDLSMFSKRILTIGGSKHISIGVKYPELEKATRQRWSRLLSQREEIVLRLIKLEEGSLPLFLLGTGLSER